MRLLSYLKIAFITSTITTVEPFMINRIVTRPANLVRRKGVYNVVGRNVGRNVLKAKKKIEVSGKTPSSFVEDDERSLNTARPSNNCRLSLLLCVVFHR